MGKEGHTDARVEQEAVDRSVRAMRKTLLEPLYIKAAYPFLAAPDAPEEAHFSVVGEQVDRLVIQTFIDQIAVQILELAHVQFIFPPLQAAGEAGDTLFEFCDTIHVRHSTLHFVCDAYRNQASDCLRGDPFYLFAIGPDGAHHAVG